jgi:hypothetical protein
MQGQSSSRLLKCSTNSLLPSSVQQAMNLQNCRATAERVGHFLLATVEDLPRWMHSHTVGDAILRSRMHGISRTKAHDVLDTSFLLQWKILLDGRTLTLGKMPLHSDLTRSSLTRKQRQHCASVLAWLKHEYKSYEILQYHLLRECLVSCIDQNSMKL